jgi:hypothetical protein
MSGRRISAGEILAIVSPAAMGKPKSEVTAIREDPS